MRELIAGDKRGKKGDLGEDESVGDREHCVFCGAVLRGRGRREGRLRGIPRAPPPYPSLPKPAMVKGRPAGARGKRAAGKWKALGGNKTPVRNTSPGEGGGGGGGGVGCGYHAIAAMETKSSPSQGGRCAKILAGLAAAHITRQPPPPPQLPTSPHAPKTLTVWRPGVQKWRVTKPQQHWTNLPGKIY